MSARQVRADKRKPRLRRLNIIRSHEVGLLPQKSLFIILLVDNRLKIRLDFRSINVGLGILPRHLTVFAKRPLFDQLILYFF